jgi:hypothetical protein
MAAFARLLVKTHDGGGKFLRPAAARWSWEAAKVDPTSVYYQNLHGKGHFAGNLEVYPVDLSITYDCLAHNWHGQARKSKKLHPERVFYFYFQHFSPCLRKIGQAPQRNPRPIENLQSSACNHRATHDLAGTSD